MIGLKSAACASAVCIACGSEARACGGWQRRGQRDAVLHCCMLRCLLMVGVHRDTCHMHGVIQPSRQKQASADSWHDATLLHSIVATSRDDTATSARTRTHTR